jgi:peptidoglycan/LPS O-acetylase OafA/YrhL
MWTRTTEVCIAAWLAMSPFIFRLSPDQTFLWATDFVCATLIAVLSLASLWPPLNKLHLGNLAICGWLVVPAFLAGPTPPPAHQNHVVVGLLLAMIAILPTRADQPPRSWRDYLAGHKQP